MSIPQVGQGAVAIVPTFKGFRSAVTKESDGAAKSGGEGFKKAFSAVGSSSGKSVGQGFRKAFDAESTGFTSRAVRELESSVAKAAGALSAARLKEQDAAGKVRLAERQLAEAREKYADDTSQVIRAEERLATANRQLETAQDGTKRSTGRLQDAQQDLARQADRTADQLGESGRRGASKFATGFSDVFKGSFGGSFLGNIASTLTSQIGYAIGAGLRRAVEFGIGTIDIASQYQDSINAVKVAYGTASDAVLDLGKDSAKTFGLSKNDLNGFATQFSSFARSIRAGDPAGFLEEIVGRATDFASVYGGSVADALSSFQSGLSGEAEPLKKFGIDLSDAATSAYAYAAGIAAPGEELTEAQKQQARYLSLLDQTKAVQGDFVNTSGELSNLNRTNAATWEDLQAAIGEGFLPIATSLASVLTATVFPAISQLVEEYGPSIGQMFEDLAPAFESFVEDVLPKLPELFQSIADTLPTIIEGAAAVLPFLVDLFGKFVLGAQQISDFFEGMNANENLWFSDLGGKLALGGQQWLDFFALVGERFALGAEQWGAFFGAVGGWFQTVSDKLVEGQNQVFAFFGAIGERFALGGQQIADFAAGVGQWIGEAIGFIGQMPGRIGEIFSGVGDWLFSSGRSLIQGFLDGINEMFGAVERTVGGIMDFIAGFFPHSPAKRGPFSGAGWQEVREGGAALFAQFQSGFGGGNLDVSTASAAAAVLPTRRGAAGGAGGPATVNIYPRFQQTDARLQMRQWGREAERAFASA